MGWSCRKGRRGLVIRFRFSVKIRGPDDHRQQAGSIPSLAFRYCRIIYKANNYACENMTEVSVFVDSRGGNTRKMADAIAEEIGITVMDVTTSPQDDAKILFLGSGTYVGKPGEAMMKFIGSRNFSGREVAIFGTSASLAGGQKLISSMTDMVKQKGATILGSCHCRGKMLLVNRVIPTTKTWKMQKSSHGKCSIKAKTNTLRKT
jgi:flavodoxin